MRFSTVFSVLACGAMALAAAVAPDALVSRANSDISEVLSGLDSKCDSILPKFDNCKESKCAESIVDEIVIAVEAATSACVELKGVAAVALAKKIVDITIKIIMKLNVFKSSCDGKCGDLSIFVKIDLCIAALLKQLAICIPGILGLCAPLLRAILTILQALSCTWIIEVCSLN